MGEKLQRTCMGCNSKKNKSELIRIVKNKMQEINIDETGKSEGRGAYICKSIDCLEKIKKNKRVEKKLNAKISDELYSNLKKIINGGEFIG